MSPSVKQPRGFGEEEPESSILSEQSSGAVCEPKEGSYFFNIKPQSPTKHLRGLRNPHDLVDVTSQPLSPGLHNVPDTYVRFLHRQWKDCKEICEGQHQYKLKGKPFKCLRSLMDRLRREAGDYILCISEDLKDEEEDDWKARRFQIGELVDAAMQAEGWIPSDWEQIKAEIREIEKTMIWSDTCGFVNDEDDYDNDELPHIYSHGGQPSVVTESTEETKGSLQHEEISHTFAETNVEINRPATLLAMDYQNINNYPPTPPISPFFECSPSIATSYPAGRLTNPFPCSSPGRLFSCAWFLKETDTISTIGQNTSLPIIRVTTPDGIVCELIEALPQLPPDFEVHRRDRVNSQYEMQREMIRYRAKYETYTEFVRRTAAERWWSERASNDEGRWMEENTFLNTGNNRTVQQASTAQHESIFPPKPRYPTPPATPLLVSQVWEGEGEDEEGGEGEEEEEEDEFCISHTPTRPRSVSDPQSYAITPLYKFCQYLDGYQTSTTSSYTSRASQRVSPLLCETFTLSDYEIGSIQFQAPPSQQSQETLPIDAYTEEVLSCAIEGNDISGNKISTQAMLSPFLCKSIFLFTLNRVRKQVLEDIIRKNDESDEAERKLFASHGQEYFKKLICNLISLRLNMYLEKLHMDSTVRTKYVSYEKGKAIAAKEVQFSGVLKKLLDDPRYGGEYGIVENTCLVILDQKKWSELMTDPGKNQIRSAPIIGNKYDKWLRRMKSMKFFPGLTLMWEGGYRADQMTKWRSSQQLSVIEMALRPALSADPFLHRVPVGS